VIDELLAGLTLAIQDPIHVTLLQRLPAFVLVGWLAGRLWPARPWMAGLTIVCLLAGLIEGLQAVLSERHALLSDWLLAGGSGALGVALAAKKLPVAGVIAGNIAAVSALALAHQDARLAYWDCAFPLTIANETGGERPWRGRLRGVTLYPRAITDAEIADLSGRPMEDSHLVPRAAAGATLAYLFDRRYAERIPERLAGQSGTALLLRATRPPEWNPANAAIDIQAATEYRSAGAGRTFCDQVGASRAFTVEAEFSTQDLAQRGPARIVSLSADPGQRNFTLGQQDAALELRVRTPGNGANGSERPLRSPGALRRDVWHRVFARFSAGTAALFLDGRASGPPLHYQRQLRIFGRSMSVDTIVGVLLAVIAGLIVWGSPTARPWRWFVTVSATAAPTALYYGWLLQVGGYPADFGLLAGMVMGPMAGVATALALRNRRSGLPKRDFDQGTGPQR
jgi:hypothetical protein